MFLKFFFGLFIVSIIFPFIYALLSLPITGLTVALFTLDESLEGKKIRRPVHFLSYPIYGMIFIAQVYILCGWSAFVSARAYVYTLPPTVTWDLIYYIVGFVLCHGPLAFMASREPDESFGSCLHTIIAMLAYILFSIWPNLMTWPYGWFLRWIYG